MFACMFVLVCGIYHLFFEFASGFAGKKDTWIESCSFLQVAGWLIGTDNSRVLSTFKCCKIKNKFALAKEALVSSHYRLRLCLLMLFISSLSLYAIMSYPIRP